MKICPVGAEVFNAGGRMDRKKDMTKQIVAFRNFVNAPKISSYGMFHHVCWGTGTNVSVDLAAPIFRVFHSNIPGFP